MRTFEEAVEIVNARRAQQSTLLQQMIAVQQRANGDFAVPLPMKERERPLVTPSLIVDSIDQPAQRAASTVPDLYVPAVEFGKPDGARSHAWAGKRRRAISATLYFSQWELLCRRAYRQIGGFGRAAMMLVPDHDAERPKLVLRDPLCSYPEPRAPEDVDLVRNAGFVFGKPAGWMVQQFGAGLLQANGGPVTTDHVAWESELWDCLEWIDEDVCYLGIIGPNATSTYQRDWRGQVAPLKLREYPNPMGIAPVVCPQVITIDKIVSRLNFMIGKSDLMSYLIDLDIAATERSVFPDRYVLADGNNAPQVVGGQWMDGRSGEVNLITGARAVGEVRSAPDPNNKQTIGMLERMAKMDGGITAVQGGEGMGAFRTGRAIDSLLGASVDPRVQELQEIMCVAQRKMNEAILGMYEAYWPAKRYRQFSGFASDTGHVDFVPATHFKESHENTVTYSMPGSDAAQATVEVGQLAQAGLISKATARRMHPHVRDDEYEERYIAVEAMREGMIQGVVQRIAQGGIPPADGAIIIEEMLKQATPEQAWAVAQQRIQERQAAQAPPPEPGQVTAPGVQPGLANPGEGAEQGVPPGPEGPPQGGPPLDVQSLLGALTSAPPAAPAAA